MRKRRIAAMALTLTLAAGTIFSGCGSRSSEDTSAKSETGSAAAAEETGSQDAGKETADGEKPEISITIRKE